MVDGQIPLKDLTDSKDSNNVNMLQSILCNSLRLGLFSLLSVGLIAIVWVITQEKINTNIQNYKNKILMEILPAGTHYHIVSDTNIFLNSAELSAGKGRREIYIAFADGKMSAVILPVTTPNGYNGNIELLIGINMEGTLTGVKVLDHKETPGLNDTLNVKASDWLLNFVNKSLTNPEAEGWRLKKDGGEFDQFTGATITPRAIVDAVYRALGYFQTNRHSILKQLAIYEIDHSGF